MMKMIKVSKAEHEMLVAAYSQDGLTIAKLEAELKQAKEDIRQMLILSKDAGMCEFCKHDYAACHNCELNAEWRGWKEDEWCR